MEGNKHYRFCARPGCDRVAEYKKGGSREIRCTCGKEFCFACRRDPHNPAPCDLVAKWYEQGDSDKATMGMRRRLLPVLSRTLTSNVFVYPGRFVGRYCEGVPELQSADHERSCLVRTICDVRCF